MNASFWRALCSHQVLLGAWVVFLATAWLQRRHVFSQGSRIAGQFTEGTAISLYLSDLSFLVLLGIWLWQRGRTTAPWRLPVVQSAIGLLAWSMLRASLVSFPLHGYYQSFRLGQGILLFLMTADMVAHANGRKILAWILMGIGVFQSLLGMTQVTRGESLGLSLVGEQYLNLHTPGVANVDLGEGRKLLRAYGTLSHPNVLGGLLVATLASTFLLLSSPQGMKRASTLFALASLQVFGLLLTFSRSAMLSFLLLLAVSLRFHVKKGLWGKILLGLGGVVCVLFFLFPPYVRLGFLRRIMPTMADQFVSERVESIATSFSFLKPQALVGLGPGQYIPTLLQRVPWGTTLRPWQYEYPHSVPAVLALELGLVGVLLFSFCIVRLVAPFSSRVSALLLLLPLLPPFLFDHYLWTLQPGRILFWGSLGVLMGVLMLSPRLREERS